MCTRNGGEVVGKIPSGYISAERTYGEKVERITRTMLLLPELGGNRILNKKCNGN